MDMRTSVSTSPAVSPSQSAGLKGAGYVVVLAMVANAFNFGDRALLGIMQEPIRAEFHLNDFYLGLMGGPAFAVLYTLMGFPIARLADRRDRVTIVSVAIGLWSLMTVLGGLATSYVQLFITRMGVSIGEAGCAPPFHSLISDFVAPERRIRAFATFAVGAPLGSMVIAILGGFLAQHYGWRSVFWAAGGLGIIFGLLVRLTIRDPRDSVPQPKDWPSLSSVLRFLWTKRSFVQCCLGAATAGFGANFILQYMASFLMRTHDLKIGVAGLIVGLTMGLAAVVGTWLAGVAGQRWADRDPRGLVFVPALGLALASVGFSGAFLSPSLVVAIACLPLACVFLNSFIGPSIAVAQAVAPANMRATSSALFLFFSSFVGFGLGPPVLGAISDFTANALLPASLSAGACLPGTTDPACLAAQASGLRLALLLASMALLVAALFYRSAARTLVQDRA